MSRVQSRSLEFKAGSQELRAKCPEIPVPEAQGAMPRAQAWSLRKARRGEMPGDPGAWSPGRNAPSPEPGAWILKPEAENTFF